MRFLPPILLATLLATACTVRTPDRPTIYHSDTDQLLVVVDGDTGSWSVAPEVRPDEYKVYCVNDSAVVELIGARERIHYALQPGDTADFVILLDGDSAFTRFIGMPWTPPARFTPAYIAAHRGQWQVEVPEVQELMLVVIALTPSGLADSNMIAHEGTYYRTVLDHFGAFRANAAVRGAQAVLDQNPLLFASLMMDANAYRFEGDALVPDSIYHRLSWDAINYASELVPALERFAKVTGFRAFYRAHQPVYDSLRSTTMAAMPVDAMWQWLEQRFESRYDHYRVLISPLIEGFHSTNHFEHDGFRQSVMFICPAYTMRDWSPGLMEGQNSRIVFTEIDHNYVNPVSDRHVREIEQALADLPQWATEAARSGYHNAYAVFNEYMTFGVFLLYAQDKLPAKDFKALRTSVVRRMERGRGFPRFGAFQDILEQVYATAPTKDIAAMYPAVITGCAQMK